MAEKKKDPKTQAFEQELMQLMLKYGFLSPAVNPMSLTVSISADSNPIISIVSISKD
jgi:hypothetical protein